VFIFKNIPGGNPRNPANLGGIPYPHPPVSQLVGALTTPVPRFLSLTSTRGSTAAARVDGRRHSSQPDNN
ncbi:hypothetical protein J6590_105710, partial [Homalodisca vitripennis]